MVNFKDFKEDKELNEGSKIIDIRDRDLTKYGWSCGFEQDDGEVTNESGNLMTNLSESELKSYLVKSWEAADLRLTKLGGNHGGHVEDYIIKG